MDRKSVKFGDIIIENLRKNRLIDLRICVTTILQKFIRGRKEKKKRNNF